MRLKIADVALDYLNEVFSCVPWDVIDHDADIDQCWLQWKDLFHLSNLPSCSISKME